MADQIVFTLSQVAQHKSKKDCWLIIHGRVLNVTKFLEEHPGGEEVLLESAGKDATKEFKDIGHSKAAENLLIKYQVGVLQGHNVKDGDMKEASSPSNTKEIRAFVIKNDTISKCKALLDFFVPVLAAASYFSFRCLTRPEQIF
ncbi:Cytochrome B5 n3 ATCB5-D CB5-D [Tripterygium wilfordii]|uniref:Cytochrome B5 n3 ATCB5-D CB5-D n=1 Tax=Tripterygium wilfordii TaxID=458696 RepID=A0A7J7CZC9_TRIWF|nr:cytochrome b5-like [Tripterygium wilfordii]KAF5739462.1 Cytochrome B5 n3 ATCB5-D CB5-D [Tripterygium wilfordii]